MVWWFTACIVTGVTQRHGAGCLVILLMAAWRAARLVRDRRSAAAWAGAVALAVACHALGGSAAQRLEANRAAAARGLAGSGGRAGTMLVGRVCGFPRLGPHGCRFPLEAVVWGRRVRLRVDAECFDVPCGARVAVCAHVVRPASVREPALRAAGLAGAVRCGVDGLRVIGSSRSLAPSTLWWRLHRAARVRLARQLGPRAALPLALLLAERGTLARVERERFARLGISHLLALSGMHLGIVAGLVWFLLRGAGRFARGAVVATLAAYVFVVGDVPSLERAFAMALLVVLARLLQRPVASMRTLGTAAFVLLAADPLSYYSVSLRLSFAATAAVVAGASRLHRGARRSWFHVALWSAGATASLGAWVVAATLPLQLHVFGRMSLVGPLATVLVLPLVAAVMTLAAAAALLSPFPPAGAWLAGALSGCVAVTETVVAHAAAWAPGPLAPAPPEPLLYYAGLAVAWKGRRWAHAAIAAALLAASFALGGR